MRKAVLLLITIFSVSASINAQNYLDGILPLKAEKVTYSGVIEAPGVAMKDLYQNARRWIIMTYQSDKNILQLDDFDNFELIGDGFFVDSWISTAFTTERVEVWQKIRIVAHRARISYEITGFRLKYSLTNSENAYRTTLNYDIENWNQGRNNNRTRFFEQLDVRVKELIESLESAVQN